MLTTVVLEGVMGDRFGRDWRFDISGPAEALRLVDANNPGVFAWIKQNLEAYSTYRVICEFEDGRIEELDNETIFMESKPVRVSFIPIATGAGGVFKFVTGMILTVIGVVSGMPWAVQLGVSLMIGGAIEMLSPKPSAKDQSERKDKTSHYFDGPVNTTMQGVPVQLIYGTVLVGSHPISADLTVDQVIQPPPSPPPAAPVIMDPWATGFDPLDV